MGRRNCDSAAPDNNRWREAGKQLLAGGMAGSVAKTVTAPLSRLAILFQVHSLVTTKEHRPKFAMSLSGGFSKIIERGGLKALWKGNLTSVVHRFPYSAINFFMYENTLDALTDRRQPVSRWQETLYKFSAGAVGAFVCSVVLAGVGILHLSMYCVSAIFLSLLAGIPNPLLPNALTFFL